MAKLNLANTRPARFALAVLFMLLAGCGERAEQLVTVQGFTMGTSYSMKWYSKADVAKEAAEVKALAEASLKAVNDAMSTYQQDSELSLFNAAPAGTEAQVSDPLYQVLTMAEDIHRQSAGTFDVTVGPLVNLWGFGPDGRIEKAPSDDELTAVRERIGANKLELLDNSRIAKRADIYVDLSAIAKGYGVDQLAELLIQRGYNAFLVEIGGELRAAGTKPGGETWKIAIEKPQPGERAVQKIISISDVGIATSGDYRNYFEQDGVRFSHTIDPATGRPIGHKLASVTVLADSAAKADALATALLVMGEQKAYQAALDAGVEAYLVIKSESGFEELATPGFSQRVVD